MEHLLIVCHREFMRGLKIDFRGRPVLRNHSEFSVELNGKLHRYSSILHNRKLLEALGDEEIDRLCLEYIVLRRACIALAATGTVAMVCLPYLLA